MARLTGRPVMSPLACVTISPGAPARIGS